MERKDRIDALAGVLLVSISILSELDQVLVKVVGEGMHPAMQGGDLPLRLCLCWPWR